MSAMKANQDEMKRKQTSEKTGINGEKTGRNRVFFRFIKDQAVGETTGLVIF